MKISFFLYLEKTHLSGTKTETDCSSSAALPWASGNANTVTQKTLEYDIEHVPSVTNTTVYHRV